MSISVSAGVPDDRTRAAIRFLADRVEATDGAPPLSDQARGRLGSAAVAHLVASDGAAVLGYAQRAEADADAPATVEVVAARDAVRPLLDALGAQPVQIWTHGRRSRLIGELERRRFRRTRELLQLRRPLDMQHPLPPDPPLADGVRIEHFVRDRDDADWLAVNAAAFATHPEQGRWSASDLRSRLDQPWFEAAGFLLARRAHELLGFHWTKVHPDGAGEVYVLGVSPTAQGLGLGQALLVRGLRHLGHRGCPTVLLYVDGDNRTALRLYERAGFAEYDLDVQWRPAPVNPAI